MPRPGRRGGATDADEPTLGRDPSGPDHVRAFREPLRPETVTNEAEFELPQPPPEARGRAGASPRRSAKSARHRAERRERAQKPPQAKGTVSKSSREAARRLRTKPKKG
jgi:hypothetical protein